MPEYLSCSKIIHMQFNMLHKNGNYFYNSVEIGLDNGSHYTIYRSAIPINSYFDFSTK